MCSAIAFLHRHSCVLLVAASVLCLAAPAKAIVPPVCLEGERCAVCGDGICDQDEGLGCPVDCDPYYGSCGDGLCNGAEDCSSCSNDCGTCPSIVCGNGICQAGETCSNCAADCGNCGPVCGNGICDGSETCSSCSADCGTCSGPVCGNALCESGETCSSCSQDCGSCNPACNPPQACQPVCGNFVCEQGETCNGCAIDCGSCPGLPVCGDGVCDLWAEDCNFCSADCCPGGGVTGDQCFGNKTCFGWDDYACDRLTHECCDIWDFLGCWPMLN